MKTHFRAMHGVLKSRVELHLYEWMWRRNVQAASSCPFHSFASSGEAFHLDAAVLVSLFRVLLDVLISTLCCLGTWGCVSVSVHFVVPRPFVGLFQDPRMMAVWVDSTMIAEQGTNLGRDGFLCRVSLPTSTLAAEDYTIVKTPTVIVKNDIAKVVLQEFAQRLADPRWLGITHK